MARTMTMAPPSPLETLANQVDDIELAALSGQDCVAMVVAACEPAREWLGEALKRGDIDAIVALHRQAETVRSYASKNKIGQRAVLAAMEIVRRAERCIALAVTEGQRAGTIETTAEGKLRGSLTARGENGRPHSKRSPKEFAPINGLARRRTRSPRGSQFSYYDLADDISDQQFEEAINAGRASGNLSRKFLATTLRGEQVVPRRQPRSAAIDLHRAIEQTVISLDGIASSLLSLEDMRVKLTDCENPEDWWEQMADEAMPTIRRFYRMLKGMYE